MSAEEKNIRLKRSTFIFTFLSDKHGHPRLTLSAMVCAQKRSGAAVVGTFAPQQEGSGASLRQVCIFLSCPPADTLV